MSPQSGSAQGPARRHGRLTSSLYVIPDRQRAVTGIRFRTGTMSGRMHRRFSSPLVRLSRPWIHGLSFSEYGETP